MVRPSPAQLRTLQYLFNHELRLPRRKVHVPPTGCDHWLGEGEFRSARVTVTQLVNRGLAAITAETAGKRCAITELGRKAVRRFS
jgi:hypothetical protein